MTAGLRIERRFTTEGVSPYDTVEWSRRDSRITNPDGSIVFEMTDAEIPSHWSQVAGDIMVSKYFRKAGVPRFDEAGAPILDEAGRPITGPERSARQVIDRLAATWRWWGEEHGYFASAQDAQVFEDELAYMLLHQMAAPNSPQWFNTGLNRRYGITGPEQGFWFVDPESDELTASPDSYSRPSPHACFIQSVDDDLVNPGGIMDLWVKEARLFKFGSGTGTNFSNLRAEGEPLSGGGKSSGLMSFLKVGDRAAGAIKCLHEDTEIVTDSGVIAIKEILPGDRVLTRWGYREVSGLHDNGVRSLVTIKTSLGCEILCTPEHRFLVRTPTGEAWKEAGDLGAEDFILTDVSGTLYGTHQGLSWTGKTHHNEIEHTLPEVLDEGMALWLGWVLGDGSVTTRDSAKFIAVQIGDADPELISRYTSLVKSVFGESAHIYVNRRSGGREDAPASVRFSSSQVIRFLEENGLRKAKAPNAVIPDLVKSSPPVVRSAFLSGLFEADGHIDNGYPVLSTVSRDLALDVHRMLTGLGIPSKITAQTNRSSALGDLPIHLIRVVSGEGVRRFSKLIGFISERKSRLLEAAVERKSASPFETQWVLPHAAGELNLLWLSAGPELRRALGPYCRYSEPRSLSLLRARSLLERFPDELFGTVIESFAHGHDLYVSATVEAAERAQVYDITVVDVHEYLVDNLVTHNSGGTTRRAAKMVILDVDHPDIETFINWKAVEEEKVRALIAAGYSSDFNGDAYATVSGQNSNNTVRMTNEFVDAVMNDEDWRLTARTDGTTMKTVKARDLWHQIAQAAWASADPGVQFHTTINEWHTSPAGGQIRASNPCSEYVFLDNTACNLASLNLGTFYDDDATGGFDLESYKYAIRIWTMVLEISVTMAHFPSEAIARGSYDYRTLGLGYANLGSVLMRMGIAYDSDEGRAIAGALTSILTGYSYATSAEMASVVGPFPLYHENTDSMLRVIRNHRKAAYGADQSEYDAIGHTVVGIDQEACLPAMLTVAHDAWDTAIRLGEEHGYRNAQTTVLAPTGCLVGGTLIPTERGLVRLRSLGDPDGPEWQDLGVQVSTDEGSRTAEQFYINGVEPVVTVQTTRGYRIQGTPTHRVKVVAPDGSWAWKRFGDIEESDLVPLQLDQLVGEPQTATLPPLGEMHWTGNFSTRVPETVNPELAEFVGYFMGDGSLHAKGLRLAVAQDDFDVIERLSSLGKSLFGLEAHTSACTEYVEVAFHSVALALWWQAAGFAKHAPREGHSGKGWHPHIPDALLHSNDRKVYSAFLRGLFEADGTVHPAGYPSWSTTSIEFSHDVQSLMLTLGIPTTRKFDTTGWGQSPLAVLRVLNPSYGEAWGNKVGFMSGRKQSAVRAISTRQASRLDHIPVNRTMVDRLAPDNDALRKTMLLSLSRNGLVSRKSATALYERSGDPELRHLLGFFYDRVASADLGEEQLTYDIMVPDNVTYVANGFISHNTIGLLMDCDTTGVEPDFALVKFKKLAGGGYFKIANQSVAPALATLGYEESEISAIIDYVVGTMSLASAPHVNAETLRAKGFTDADLGKIEAMLPGVFEIGFAFNQWTLGEEAMQRLGFTVEEYNGLGFNMLSALGFSESEVNEANDIICGRQAIEGAPGLRDEHLQVFDTANKNGKYGERYIHHIGHIKMMAAAQPFISGAISKTINMPNEATVDDIEESYKLSWELGLKAMALYRDGSKASQPLSSTSDEGASDEESDEITAAIEREVDIFAGMYRPGMSPSEAYEAMPRPRFLLPSRRAGFTQEARVGGHKVFLRTGEYDDGTLGEIFLDLAKEGATLRGILGCFAIAVSKGLQYGVPLEEYVDTFTFQTFEPRGMVEGHPNIKMSNSIVDYVFRALGIEYLHRDELAQVPPDRAGDLPEPPKGAAVEAGLQLDLTDAVMEQDIDAQVRAARFADEGSAPAAKISSAPSAASVPSRTHGSPLSAEEIQTAAVQAVLADKMGDAPLCDTCGHITVRNGSCYRCLNCGDSKGCS